MRKRGESWELRVFLENDPVTGKQRYATKTSRGGKREAQRQLAEMITEVERGLSVTTNATVGELLEAWLEMASRDFSPKTVKETRGVIDRNLLPHIGSTPLKKLRSSDLDRLYQRLQASGGVGGNPLAPATVRRTHGILRRALGQGVKWGWIGVNPAAATTPPRVPASEIAPPEPADLARVQACRNGLPRAGVLPRVGGGHRSTPFRTRGVALDRCRSRRRDGVDRTRCGVRAERTGREGHQDALGETSGTRRPVACDARRTWRENVYAHFLAQSDREAADVIGVLIAPLVEDPDVPDDSEQPG